jgi:hypothetical protein
MKYTMTDLARAEEYVVRAEGHLLEHKRLLARLKPNHPDHQHQQEALGAYEFALAEHRRRRDAIRAELQPADIKQAPAQSDANVAAQ